VTLALVALAFAVLSALAGIGATGAVDAATLEAAQRYRSPALDAAGSLLTLAGRMETCSAIAALLALAGYRRAGIRGLVPLLLFAGAAIEVALKIVLQHPGPPDSLHRDLGLLAVPGLEFGYSYPSGHELRATFLALLGAPAGAWRVLAWLFVAAMGVSRVYLAEHWLSDVVGGLLLGIALVLVARYSRAWRRAR